MLTKTKLETVSKDDIPQCIPAQPEFNCHIEKRIHALSDEPYMSKSDKDRNKKLEMQVRLVKLLREYTGAGLMECKKALTETDWSFFKASIYLKEHSGIHVLYSFNQQKKESLKKRKYSGKPTGFKYVLVETNCKHEEMCIREQIDGNLEILDTTDDGSYSVRVATIMDIEIIQEAILKGKENDHV